MRNQSGKLPTPNIVLIAHNGIQCELVDIELRR